jgi:hypothetical protein
MLTDLTHLPTVLGVNKHSAKIIRTQNDAVLLAEGPHKERHSLHGDADQLGKCDGRKLLATADVHRPRVGTLPLTILRITIVKKLILTSP